MAKPLFPTWQIDRQEYDAVCRYLDLTPRGSLFEKLDKYLVHAPFRFAAPGPFARFLSRKCLTHFRIARLDLVTKLLYPNHPVRHILNAVIALHECDGKGFVEMNQAPQGRLLVFSLIRWGIWFVASVLLTLIWMLGNLVLFGITLQWWGYCSVRGRTVLITGVNGGLGFDLMTHALERGAQVIGSVRGGKARADVLALLPKEAPLTLVSADLSSPGSLPLALDGAGIEANSVDIAVLCAGVKHDGSPILSMPEIRNTFEVNLFSAVEFAAWFDLFSYNKTLVLVSSIGRWHGMHSTCAYNASKAALSIWAESLEMELKVSGGQNSRIMVVEPGLFESGMVPDTGIRSLLVASRQALAKRILVGACRGDKSLRYPFWFALVTWGVLLGGRRLRSLLFARVKNHN